MDKYGFVGIEFWGCKTFSEFEKYFKKRIPPKDIKAQYEAVKGEYKKKYPEVKKKKETKIEGGE